jgi:prepilin-type processing-associated H-X9-DG protein
LKQVYVKIDGGEKTVINESKEGKYLLTTEKGKSYVFGADFKSVVASFADIIAEDPEDETQVGFEGKLIAVSDLGNQMDGAIFYDGENYGFVKQGNKGNTKYPPAATITTKTIGNNYKVMASYNNESRGHYINVDSYASIDCSIADSTKTIAAPSDTAVAWGATELAAFGDGDLAKHVTIADAVVGVNKADITFSVGSYTKGAISNASNVTFVDGHKYTLEGYAAANYNGKSYFVITGATDTTPVVTGLTCVSDLNTIGIGEVANLSAVAIPSNGILGTVTYEITEGSEFATISSNVVTGVAVGTVKVVAKTVVGSATLTSEAISIAVTAAVAKSTITLTQANFTSFASLYANYTGSITAGTTAVNLTGFQIYKGDGDTIQMRTKNGPSAIYNTVAMPKAITSMEFTFTKNNGFNVYMSNSASISTDPTTATETIDTDVVTSTLNFDSASAYTYFRFTTKGSANITSVKISYLA